MISPGGSLANNMFGFPCDFDQESAHSARRRFAKERFVPNGNKKTTATATLSTPSG